MTLKELFTTLKVRGEFGLSWNFKTTGSNVVNVTFDEETEYEGRILTDGIDILNAYVTMFPKLRSILDTEVAGIKCVYWRGSYTMVFVLSDE